ncbi:DUF502 domain-containing protein [bacterium]|nr:DUF502 domain-containing protein [bacterium]MCK4326806.1 DUF502 domain-containing protein [bacterium]MCK4436863.1 DUF502 domain-containing protein [bacterium]
MRIKVIARLRNNFVAGLLVVLPIVVTILILNIILNFIVRIVPQAVVANYFDTAPWKYLWKGLAVIGILFVIFLIGVLARNIIGRRLIGLGEKILIKIPLVSRIYGALQQISQAFLGERRTGFNRVILFQYPRGGLYTLGLVSGEGGGEIKEKTGEKMLSVFVPTTPNPTSGLLILVPEKDTIPLKMTVEEALKLLISGGTVVPYYQREIK